MYSSRRGEKTDQFLLQKIGNFFSSGVREQCKKKYAKPVPRNNNKSKAVVGKETTKSSATPCTYTKTSRKPSFTQLFLIFFFPLLPGDSNLTDCRDPRAHRFSMPRVKIWGEKTLLKYVELGSECHPF